LEFQSNESLALTFHLCFAVCRCLGYTHVSSPGRIFGAKCANQNQEARRSKEEIPSADKGEPGFYVVLGRLTLTSVAAVEWLNMAKD